MQTGNNCKERQNTPSAPWNLVEESSIIGEIYPRVKRLLLSAVGDNVPDNDAHPPMREVWHSILGETTLTPAGCNLYDLQYCRG
ncbi:hypothetical protein NDU88_008824 [Pleurodeles waltl]|uniref:Uncharacterized protein n=1 Tax=Pleurodeles waltl TaxID=8319 RepID=A0AAV7RUV9_PLEWA|nr:hypothetical protein NDU88_008824 [Pleurodeles waltl]